jgi:DNA-binding NtrC family response regulator
VSASVLVVDDEPIIRDTLAEFLQQEGFTVESCGTGEAALALAGSKSFDVALCDINLPGIDGMDVLQRLLQLNPETFVLLITAYATVETAVEAFQKGAQDYLMKPILLPEVSRKIRRLLEQRDVRLENQWLRRELHRQADTNPEMVLGRSPAMKQVMDLARKVAPTPSTILILGESGTGKELLARALHRIAQAAKPTDGKFLALNCAAIPADMLENQLFGHRKGAFTGADKDTPGVFVAAGAGTLFLDEIGELPMPTQAKLLRAIEQKEILPVGASEPVTFSARILAATNKDLQKEVAAGRFRNDLYYRLNVVSLTLPSLRERTQDLPEFVEFLLVKHGNAMGKPFTGLSREAMQAVLANPWPGNIRELDNAIQRAAILGEPPLVQVGDLPGGMVLLPGSPFAVDNLADAYARFEKMHLEKILSESPDKRDAAKRLGIGLSSLYRKIEEHGLGEAEGG